MKTLIFFVFVTLVCVAVVGSLVDINLRDDADDKDQDHRNGGWTILGFDNLLVAIAKAKESGKCQTVKHKSSGKRYVIEIREYEEPVDKAKVE